MGSASFLQPFNRFYLRSQGVFRWSLNKNIYAFKCIMHLIYSNEHTFLNVHVYFNQQLVNNFLAFI